MKNFLGTFAICFVICVIAVMLLSGLFGRNAWVDIAVVALLLALFITVLEKHSARIEELEETVKRLQNEIEQPSES